MNHLTKLLIFVYFLLVSYFLSTQYIHKRIRNSFNYFKTNYTYTEENNYENIINSTTQSTNVKLATTFSTLNDTKYARIRPNISYLLSLGTIRNETYENIPNISSRHWTHVDECELNIKNFLGKLQINLTSFSWTELLKKEKNLTTVGGRNWPKDCRVKSMKVAIVVCYRNREEHLKTFLSYMHPFLRKQKLDYMIVVVEQMPGRMFNRGMLFNIGFIEVKRIDPTINCFIFHDVDLLPEDDRNLYVCGEYPRHLTVSIDKYDYKLLYPTNFGGATAFTDQQFMGVDGFSNEFWGWGGEDDDLYIRVREVLGSIISRYPSEIARYTMLSHTNKESSPPNPYRHILLGLENRFFYDGLHRTRYAVQSVRFQPLFLNITVAIHENKWSDIKIDNSRQLTSLE